MRRILRQKSVIPEEVAKYSKNRIQTRWLNSSYDKSWVVEVFQRASRRCAETSDAA
jgi:hypothetical protein